MGSRRDQSPVHCHFDSLADILRKAAIGEVTRFIDDQLDPDDSVADVENADIWQAIPLDVLGTDTMPVLVVETYLAALRDSGLADLLSEQLDRYRGAMTAALARIGNPSPAATARVVHAAMDGLVLQKRLDPAARIDDSVKLLHSLVSRTEDSR